MTDSTVRERLVAFCLQGDIKKVKAIYTMVEHDINSIEEIDDEMLAELDRRTASFVAEEVQTYTIEEARSSARSRLKEVKK